MTSTTTLKHFFQPALERLSPSGERQILNKGGFFGGKVLVLPRALCRYQYRAGDFGDARALQALELKIQFETPFANPGHYVLRSPHGAHIWTWDQDALPLDAPPRAGLRLIPESALYPAPAGNQPALRLIRCIDGVEGQIWDGRDLKTARWWPQAPGSLAWQAFLKAGRWEGAGDTGSEWDENRAPGQPLSLPLTTPKLIDRPFRIWAVDTGSRHLVPLAIILFLGPFSYQLSAWASATWMTSHYQNKAKEIRLSAQSLLADRREALSALQKIDQQQALGDESIAVSGLLEWARILDAYPLTITRVQFSDRSIAVYADAKQPVDAPAIIAALEESPIWSGVTLQPSVGSILIVRGELSPFLAPFPLEKPAAEDAP
ncbi:hypothetical protein AQ1_01415 [alpha proteobacterium Q-1]|nr:hypothetical protein AQ1_01415 [alpha proteobacterium Q-1]